MLLKNIASISQKDSRWWRKHLGTSNITIGTAGCLLCCSTIVCRFYGKDTWPDELNERMKEVGGYYDENLWIWTAVSKIYPDVGHKRTINCYNNPAPLDEIKKRLDEGHPVIVMTFVGKITHYVLIFGYDDKGFYTCDPNKGDVVLFKDRFGDPAKNIYKIDFYDGPLREEKPPEEPQKPEIEIPVAEIETPCPKIEESLKKIRILLMTNSAELSHLNNLLGKWQGKVESANKRIAKLEELNVKTDEERKNFQRLYKDALERTIEKATLGQLLSALVGCLKNTQRAKTPEQ